MNDLLFQLPVGLGRCRSVFDVMRDLCGIGGESDAGSRGNKQILYCSTFGELSIDLIVTTIGLVAFGVFTRLPPGGHRVSR